jgi:hypothetical protein
VWFDINHFRNREIIFVTDEAFGVRFCHWIRRRSSWSLRWENALGIDAMQIEPAEIALVFLNAENRWRFLSEDMENWGALETTVRTRYPDFDWENFERAKNYIDTRFPCWKRPEI